MQDVWVFFVVIFTTNYVSDPFLHAHSLCVNDLCETAEKLNNRYRKYKDYLTIKACINIA